MDFGVFSLLLARGVVALVLLLAGISKLLEPRTRLKEAVLAYGVASWFAAPIASVLPATEICLAILVLAGFLMPLSALLAAAMFAVFAVAMGVNLAKRKTIPCACFSIREESPITWGRVSLDLVLAIVACLASGWPWRSWDWPLALVPDTVHVSSTDALVAGSVATGLIAALVLLRAFVALPRLIISPAAAMREEEPPRDAGGRV